MGDGLYCCWAGWKNGLYEPSNGCGDETKFPCVKLDVTGGVADCCGRGCEREC